MITIENSSGSIIISTDVFTTITGMAATKCFGVKGMAMRSMTDGLIHLLKREAMGKGVRVWCDEEDGSLDIELHIIVENGINIPVACGSIISEVRYVVESTTGVRVRTVEVYVDSVVVS